ncbi:hypothetical protein G5714_021205 [Onychostoma macrolepis]|uniref:Uncharacterized protein n=1 Tax=Onychostoma macrolepis TaxID=369639 RepID=A0A7J6BQD8_9TELE|nr:hypothetical protein G5714_021205 [Onychostoma macrolepis]
MGPAGKFLNVRQGDRSIEDYARDFVGVARQSAAERTCLMIFSGRPSRALQVLMPYWHPSHWRYINRALYLRGSSSRVEFAVEPVHRSLGAASKETSQDREQYHSKLVLANGDCLSDPELLTEWVDDVSKWPDIHWPAIYCYLVDKPSVYTREKLRAYKSLDTYNYVVCGHVQTVLYSDIGDDF